MSGMITPEPGTCMLFGRSIGVCTSVNERYEIDIVCVPESRSTRVLHTTVIDMLTFNVLWRDSSETPEDSGV